MSIEKIASHRIRHNINEVNEFLREQNTLKWDFKHALKAHRGELKQELNRRNDEQ